MKFDKSKLQFNFSKASAKYDKQAELQKIVAGEVFLQAENYLNEAKNIIDLGAGTGLLIDQILQSQLSNDKKIFALDIAALMLQTLQNKHSEKQIFCINADIDHLPFLPEKFDLALSSLVLHWMNDLDSALAEIAASLKKNGHLIFSVVAEDSLAELKTSCKKLQIDLAINQFISEQHLKKAVSRYFTIQKIEQQKIVLQYDDLWSMLYSIKAIGANYSPTSKILTRAKLAKLADFYLKNFAAADKVFASWQVAIVTCKKV